jgi:hypothetical protein
LFRGEGVVMKNRTIRALKKNWFVKHSYKQTVRNMIEVSDVSYLKTVSLNEFENLLLREVEFIAPYDEEEAKAVKEYIHTHIEELYKLVKELSPKCG